jgi:threonine synthase
MNLRVRCTNCGRLYPEEGMPYRCRCGGIFDYADPFPFDPQEIDRNQRGVWRYRAFFGFPETLTPITLGEGNTPLIALQAFGKTVYLKNEFLQPTGSFKDRGMTTLVTFLKGRGVTMAVEDSSGNAGASFAAYAARAGIRARIFVPEDVSGPKRQQIEALGAEVIPVPGARSRAAEMAQAAADAGLPYASHAWLPFNLPGYSTLAYELVEQLGEAPGSVIVPVGQGGLLLGMARGFRALEQSGQIRRRPRLIAVQAQACAPIAAVYHFGPLAVQWVRENPTLAEGVRVRVPLRGEKVLQEIQESEGEVLAIMEEEILPARDALAQHGIHVEPTAALAWAALARLFKTLPEPVILILTGAGYKVRL